MVVRAETILGDTVKMGNFEQTAYFLLLESPMRKNYTPENEHHISAVSGEGSDDNNKANNYKGFKIVDKGSSELFSLVFRQLLIFFECMIPQLHSR